MNKRQFLRKITGKKETATGKQRSQSYSSMASLIPYSGPWGYAQASHLMRRTTFGPTKTMFQDALDQGLSASIDKLLADKTMPAPPVYIDFDEDPFIASGESWVTHAIPPELNVLLNAPRRKSLYGWIYDNMKADGFSIREKMHLFWQNHFAVENIARNTFAYQYHDLIRKNALGNFKEMVQEITISPGMLIFLNGTQNTRFSPNENYGRELLELFTIGRGPEAGPGDYTNYTENDVRELSRALTGWVQFVEEDGTYGSRFIANRHDTDPKVLSPRFDNIEINDEGENEYKTVIDIILQKKETARFICRQLHIWFVGKDIDDDIETNIIGPLADIFYNSNYQIKPVLETLLRSEYFFDSNHIGCMINHPIDMLYKLLNSLELELSTDKMIRWDFYKRIRSHSVTLGMVPIILPSVAGWKAFYQAPQYYEDWINSTSLLNRQAICKSFVNGFNVSGIRYEYDLISFVERMDNNLDPNEMIQEIALLICPSKLSQSQVDYLKEILIPGLPDYEWTVEYTDFLADPENTQLRNGVNNKLKALFNAMVTMPEFYLI